MSGVDSWIQLHICNKRGDCCSSKALKNTAVDRQKRFNLSPTDPCGDLFLDLVDPSTKNSTLDVEHFGPDGTILSFVRVETANALMKCDTGADMTFPNSGRAKFSVTCNLYFVQIQP